MKSNEVVYNNLVEFKDWFEEKFLEWRGKNEKRPDRDVRRIYFCLEFPSNICYTKHVVNN